MHNLFAPLIIGDLQVAGGTREIAVVAGISDNIYGIDVEKGHADLEAPFRQHLR